MTGVPPAPVLAGESLAKLFPSIDTHTLLEIVRHEFHPVNLYKLDVRYKSELDADRFDNAPRTGTLKDYPSLHSLIIPLTTYFRALQAFVAFSPSVSSPEHATFIIGDASGKYIAYLIELHQEYEWGAVLQYHMENHLHQRQEMLSGVYTGWSEPSSSLQNRYLFNHRNDDQCRAELTKISMVRYKQDAAVRGGIKIFWKPTQGGEEGLKEGPWKSVGGEDNHGLAYSNVPEGAIVWCKSYVSCIGEYDDSKGMQFVHDSSANRIAVYRQAGTAFKGWFSFYEFENKE